MIIHLTTVHPRNDIRVFERIAKTINRELEEVILYVSDSLGNEIRDGIKIRDLGRSPDSIFLRIIKSWCSGSLVALRHRPEIIHFHDPELLPLIPFWCMLGINVIYDVHEELGKQLREKRKIPKLLRLPLAKIVPSLERLFSLGAKKVSAATPTIAKNFDSNKVFTIQNFPSEREGLDTPQTSPKNGSTRLIYVGGITERRSLFEILDAVNIVAKTHKIALTLAGRFSPPELEDRAINHPGWKNTEFLGWVGRESFANLMGESTCGLVLCHPERNYLEAQCTKLFEYMWGGLPVIASDFKVWRDFTDSPEGIMFVDPLSSKAIAAAMISVLDNPEWSKMSGQRLQRYAKERFSWEDEEKKLIRMYRNIRDQKDGIW